MFRLRSIYFTAKPHVLEIFFLIGTWSSCFNMDRVDLRNLSRNNLQIFDDGSYSLGGKNILLPEMKTHYYDSQYLFEPTVDAASSSVAEKGSETVFCTSGLGSFQCAQKLASAHAGQKIAVLNFASAKKPGGGFLNGAMAQEEALCYQSNLYDSLTSKAASHFYYYEGKPPVTYTHRMLYSTGVSVFRDTEYKLVPQQDLFQVDVITCAAVNRKICFGPNYDALVYETMKERAWRIVALAAAQNVRHLVLGAWGCGVFGNSVSLVTRLFVEAIMQDFASTFASVSFAMPDKKHFATAQKTIASFGIVVVNDSEQPEASLAASSSAPPAATAKTLVGGQRIYKKR